MFDFEGETKKAISSLSEITPVVILDYTERTSIGLEKYANVVKIFTEIFTPDNFVKRVVLFMAFPGDFPLVIPKVFISRQDKFWIGHIPHVDMSGNVCIYDEESIVLDVDRADEIVKLCLYKSIEVIEQGLKGNNGEDFIDEFVSYWTQKYDDKDEIYLGLNMLEKPLLGEPSQISLLTFNESFSGYHVILHDHGKHFNRFKSFLEGTGIATEERVAFYLGEITGLRPPFSFTNGNAGQIVNEYFPHAEKSFQKYVNQVPGYCLIVCSVISGTNSIFIGWFVRQLNTKRKGFRNNALTPFDVFSSFQKNDQLIRFRFDQFTKERLGVRTDGVSIVPRYRVTLVGLGSIGSHLMSQLLPLGIDSVHLIDPDILILENINRHVLGTGFIGKPKVEGMRDYILQFDPLIDVFAHQESIVRYIRKGKLINNQVDYLFVVIGKKPVEDFILHSLANKIIEIPTFIIWIEPYLIGGHCLYVQPGHTIDFSKYYDKNLFKYNLIDKSEYQNSSKQISLREAGCTGVYVPYGQKNIGLFLSSLVPYLYDIIENKDQRNLVLTWRGKNPNATSLKLSDFAMQLEIGSIKLNELYGN